MKLEFIMEEVRRFDDLHIMADTHGVDAWETLLMGGDEIAIMHTKNANACKKEQVESRLSGHRDNTGMKRMNCVMSQETLSNECHRTPVFDTLREMWLVGNGAPLTKDREEYLKKMPHMTWGCVCAHHPGHCRCTRAAGRPGKKRRGNGNNGKWNMENETE
jgi:hypothetical protein